MAMNFVQSRTTSLSISISETETSEIKLKQLLDAYGNELAMSDFGDIGYIVIDAGSDSEEIISFTDFTVNSDGTVSIDTGIVRALLPVSPYGAGGTANAHSAGARVVVSNVPQIYDYLKDYIDSVAIAGAPDASETTKGLVEQATQAEVDAKTEQGATGAYLNVNPSQIRNTSYNDYVADTGSANVYAIAPSPAITAYSAGQYFTFKVTNTNTGASTLNVDSLGAKNIYKDVDAPLAGGDLRENQIVSVIYDGTNFQLVSRANDTYALNAGETINGATLPVPVYQNKTDNEVYGCDANDTDKMKFFGFGITNGTDANPIVVQHRGVVSGFTGLSEGEKYYVQDDGTIGTSIGTQEILVGMALSETDLLIMRGKRTYTISGAEADGDDEEIHNIDVECGFRASKIKVTIMTTGGGGDLGKSVGTYENGLYNCIYYYLKSSSTENSEIGNVTNLIAKTVDNSNSPAWQGTITNLDDTGFTLALQQKNASVQNAYYIIEAEGEL